MCKEFYRITLGTNMGLLSMKPNEEQELQSVNERNIPETTEYIKQTLKKNEQFVICLLFGLGFHTCRILYM